MARWRLLALATALLAYALGSWAVMRTAPHSLWAVGLLFGPLLLPLLANGVLRRHGPSLLGALLLLALLVAVLLRGGSDMERLYVLQHAGIHLLLGWSFAITLRPGATPLITLMAQRLHRDFTPAMRAYTGWLTGLWVAYFAAMVAVSLLIYVLAPWSWWSFFYTVITPLAALLLFGLEHVLRYWRHPEFERVSLAQVARAWQSQRSGGEPR